MTDTPVPCAYCGHELQLVWVHGHGQCAHCGINVAPCCDGDAMCPTPAADAGTTKRPETQR